jgi:hypothetical protein
MNECTQYVVGNRCLSTSQTALILNNLEDDVSPEIKIRRIEAMLSAGTNPSSSIFMLVCILRHHSFNIPVLSDSVICITCSFTKKLSLILALKRLPDAREPFSKVFILC